MLSRSLFTLAMQGYGFPAPNTFKSLAPTASAPRPFPAVRVRVLRPFYGLRRLLEVGEIVNLAEPDATDAVALGRAKLL